MFFAVLSPPVFGTLPQPSQETHRAPACLTIPIQVPKPALLHLNFLTLKVLLYLGSSVSFCKTQSNGALQQQAFPDLPWWSCDLPLNYGHRSASPQNVSATLSTVLRYLHVCIPMTRVLLDCLPLCVSGPSTGHDKQ